MKAARKSRAQSTWKLHRSMCAAGAIIPMDPVRQYTAEKNGRSHRYKVYPGADGSFLLYDDDGATFNHRKGEWTAIQMTYNDARRTLAMRAAHGSPKRTFSIGGRIVHFRWAGAGNQTVTCYRLTARQAPHGACFPTD